VNSLYLWKSLAAEQTPTVLTSITKYYLWSYWNYNLSFQH